MVLQQLFDQILNGLSVVFDGEFLYFLSKRAVFEGPCASPDLSIFPTIVTVAPIMALSVSVRFVGVMLSIMSMEKEVFQVPNGQQSTSSPTGAWAVVVVDGWVSPLFYVMLFTFYMLYH